MATRYDAIVVGGGFYGTYIAEHLALRGQKVAILERGTALMNRASFNNQARVHNGYHYPRSTVTALRSHHSFPRFTAEFQEAIVNSFDNYYLIGKVLGNVTAGQFRAFCKRIDIPCMPDSGEVHSLINTKLVEAVFKTQEYAFDSAKLSKIMQRRLDDSGVNIEYRTTVEYIEEHGNGLVAHATDTAGQRRYSADQVFNCTYSALNHINSRSSIATIPLKHELTEMCLVNVPRPLQTVGITVMCGPFFSVMPFPPNGLHSFSHVRYTPHFDWHDRQDRHVDTETALQPGLGVASAWKRMQKDAERYIPILSECQYDSSLWEVKTVLPARERDDGRPILFSINHGVRGYHCIMGGKVDNVYDIVETIQTKGLDR